MEKEFEKKNARILLQLGLAFAFLYAASASFLRPTDWVGYLPHYIRTLSDPYLLLKVFSTLEIILAVWLVSGWKLFYAGLFAALVLAAITLANLTIFDVTFRDVSLLFAALALAILSKNENSK